MGSWLRRVTRSSSKGKILAKNEAEDYVHNDMVPNPVVYECRGTYRPPTLTSLIGTLTIKFLLSTTFLFHELEAQW